MGDVQDQTSFVAGRDPDLAARPGGQSVPDNRLNFLQERGAPEYTRKGLRGRP